MRPLALFIMAFSLATIGCVSLEEVPPGATDAAPSVLEWDLNECTIATAWTPVDPTALQAELPEGFTARARGVVPMVGGPIEQSIMGVEIFRCATGTGVDGVLIGGMVYGSFWAPVSPPDDLAGEAEDFYMKWDIVMPDAPRRALFEAAGATVHDGEASFELRPGQRAVHGEMRMGDLGMKVLDFVVDNEPADDGGGFTFREFTPTAAGRIIVWEADFTAHQSGSGRGTFTVPEGSLAARVIGATTAQATFNWGTWTFDGTVTIPE